MRRTLSPRPYALVIPALILTVALLASAGMPAQGQEPSSLQADSAAGQLWLQNLAEDTLPRTVNVDWRSGAEQVPWANLFIQTRPLASELVALQPLGQPLPPGEYSARISAMSDFPTLALARTEWPVDGAATLYHSAKQSANVVAPFVTKQHGPRGETSRVVIQNAHLALATKAVVTLRAMGMAAPVLSHTWTIPAGRSVALDLGTDAEFAALPDGYVGVMRVEGTSEDGMTAHPVAVVTSVRTAASASARGAYEGAPANMAGTSLVAPTVRSQSAAAPGSPTLNTRIAIQSVGSGPAHLTLTYRGADRPGNSCRNQVIVHGDTSHEIVAGSGMVFDAGPGGGSGLPSGCEAVAEIEAQAGTFAAVVIETSTDARHMAAFRAVSAAETDAEVHLPMFRRRAGGRTTAVTAMNTGDTATQAEITFTFINDGLKTIKDTQTIAPGQSVEWHPDALAYIPDGTIGTASVKSTGPSEPLAVVVREHADTHGDDPATYNALPRPEPMGEAGYAPHFVPSVSKEGAPPATATPTDETATPDTATPTVPTAEPTEPTHTPTQPTVVPTDPSGTPTDPSATPSAPSPTSTAATATPTTTYTTPPAPPTGGTPTTTATPPCTQTVDVLLVAHASTSAERDALLGVLEQHRAAFEAQFGHTMGTLIYSRSDANDRSYRSWLRGQIDSRFSDLGVCAEAYVAVVSYNDLAELRASMTPLDNLIEDGTVGSGDFLPGAWDPLHMSRHDDAAPMQMALPWLRAGCSESYRNLALVDGYSGGAETGYTLMDYLNWEAQQLVSYERSPSGVRLGYPTRGDLYDRPVNVGGETTTITCYARPVPNAESPERVSEAIRIAQQTARNLEDVTAALGAPDYSRGAYTDEVVFALGTGGDGSILQADDDAPIAFAAVKMDLTRMIATGDMEQLLARPEGVIVGELSIYSPTVDPGPTPAPGGHLIYLPLAELPWTQGHAVYYQGYAVRWRQTDSGVVTELIGPDFVVIDPAELLLPVDTELVFPTEDTNAASDVWLEEGSRKFCWHVDSRRGCVRFG